MKLTKKEQDWLKGVQKALDRCPSDRIGFFTIGDNTVYLYDLKHEAFIDEQDDDLPRILTRNGWGCDDWLTFPNQVAGVCG